MTLVSASETILKAIEKRFLETGSPNHLTLVHSCGQSDRDRGIQHFSHEEMLYPYHRRTLGSAATYDETYLRK